MDGKSAETPQDPQALNAATELQKFLEEKGIELRLTPPNIRSVDAGGLLIDQPQIVANYKVKNSISN